MKLKQFIIKISKVYHMKKYQAEFKKIYEKHTEEAYKRYKAWVETFHTVSK